MAIKKAFIALNALLEANSGKKVSSIIDQAVELMSAKGAGGGATSVCRNEAGDVVGILDYYFKKWLPIEFVEFGSKANSSTGLNTMCKAGTSLWTKQQRDFKKAKEQLLEDVSAGEVQPTEIQAKLDELEVNRGFVADYPVTGLAFDSAEELLAGLAGGELDGILEDHLAAEAEAERVAAEALATEEEQSLTAEAESEAA